MQTKGLIGLLAATAAAVAGAVVVSIGDGGSAADPLQGTPVLPALSNQLDDVGRVALVHGDTKLTLVRKDKNWVVEEKEGYPADPVKLRQTLLGLADLRFVEPKTRKPELYPRLEVEDAGKKGAKSTLITVADRKGSMLGEVIAGKRRDDQLGSGTDGIYVRKPGDAQSWLASGTLDVSGETVKWLDRQFIDLPEKRVKQAVQTQPDGTSITIRRDKPEDKLTLAELPAGKKLKSDGVLDEPAAALAGLELTDVRPAKGFDFPKTGVAKAEYTTFDGLTVTVELIEKDGTNWLKLRAAGSGDAAKKAAEINARTGGWVYAVAAYKASALRTKLADLVEAPKAS